MEQRHQEYIDYYKARMKKYENNSLYLNSYESEKALYEAIANVEKLEDFKDVLFKNNLHVKNAIALVKDQEKARFDHFMKLKETIRAKGPKAVLDVVDQYTDIDELTTKTGELHQTNSVEISVDLLNDEFYSDFTYLENVLVYETAKVPKRWEKKYREWAKEDIKKHNELWEENTLPNARNWDPNWDLNYDLLWEERHRRKIPIPDEALKKRIEQHKRYRGL